MPLNTKFVVKRNNFLNGPGFVTAGEHFQIFAANWTTEFGYDCLKMQIAVNFCPL